MGTTGANLMISPDVFLRAMQAAVSDAALFMASSEAAPLAAAIDVNPSMAYGAESVNNLVRVPAWTNLGDFQDVGTIANDGSGYLADGTTPIAIQSLGMKETFAQVRHGLSVFNITEWARANPLGDPYTEGARQAAVSLFRFMDAQGIKAACSDSVILQRDGTYSTDAGLVLDVYDSNAPRYFDYQLACDGYGQFREFQKDIAGVVVHPKVRDRLRKLTDSTGRPLYTSATEGGPLNMFGIPVYASGRLPVAAASAMTAVVATGTTPPAITLTGTPLVDIDLRIECMKTGTLTNSKIRWSINGGATWVQDGAVNAYVATAATIPLTDTRGNLTGVTINIAAGTGALDNVWTATTNSKFTSLILKKKSLVFWYNKQMMSAMGVPIPILNANQTALHVYCASARYQHTPDCELPGVVRLFHN